MTLFSRAGRTPRGRYGWPQFFGDCSGGLIAALIALPYGLAMATLMGLPPLLGVCTSIVTAPVIALLGRNPVLVGGTASATVPFIAAAVSAQGIGGAAKVSIVASVIMMGFCVMKLGRYMMHVPHAVVSGFSCGIGAMMLVSQLDTLLGIRSAPGRAPGSTLLQAASLLDRLGDARLVPMILGLSVILTAILVARLSPRLPAPLLGVALAFLLAKVFGFTEKEVGDFAFALPDFAGFSWKPQDVFVVLPSALGLAVVSSVNILITSRIVEHFRGRHRRMRISDADSELGAYGIANVFAGMFGAPLSVGIPARSLAVVRCGGTTRLANLLHALFLGAIVWLGSRFVAHIPLAALAGVTAWMGLSLLDWSTWRRLPRMNRVDSVGFLVTAGSVLAANAVLAVALGCSVYGIRFAYQRWVRPTSSVPDLQVP